ncbi:MAG: hypothetical protein OEW67_03900 [Cyclobacteriaceae bacterium]|nr:hypothetical protein [Cyclobacteriaceae bacterium]
MINNILKLLSLSILTSLLLVVGCKKDEDPVPEPMKVISTFEFTLDNVTGTTTFNYNADGLLESLDFVGPLDSVNIVLTFSNGLLTEASGEGFRSEYSYDANGNLLEILDYDDNNGDGIIGLYNKYTYTYNLSNQVTREDEVYYYEQDIPDSWSDFTLFEYANTESKNPISGENYVEINSDGGTLSSTIAYTFDDKVNPLYKAGVWPFLVSNDFTTNFSPNNLVNANITVNAVEESNMSVNNEYDANNDLIKSTFTISRPGSADYIYSTSITYKEI